MNIKDVTINTEIDTTRSSIIAINCKCEICDSEFSIDLPYCYSNSDDFRKHICDNCKDKLRKLILGDKNDG